MVSNSPQITEITNSQPFAGSSRSNVDASLPTPLSEGDSTGPTIQIGASVQDSLLNENVNDTLNTPLEEIQPIDASNDDVILVNEDVITQNSSDYPLTQADPVPKPETTTAVNACQQCDKEEEERKKQVKRIGNICYLSKISTLLFILFSFQVIGATRSFKRVRNN